MKTIMLIAALFLLGSSGSNVYICVSPNAKKYHFSKSCRGLSNCKHDIKLVPRSEAVNMELEVCGWED